MSAPKIGNKKVYRFPDPGILKEIGERSEFDRQNIPDKKLRIERALHELGVKGTIKNCYPGPAVTTYEFYPKPGVKEVKVINTAETLTCILGVEPIRIQRTPKKSSINIEIPNARREVIRFSDIVESRAFLRSRSKLVFPLGKTARGGVYFGDLEAMPHLLLAGDTGSGKSCLLHVLIASILFKASPEEVKLILIDPKRLEFTHYDGLPHLLVPVISSARKALAVLAEAVKIMEERYAFLNQHKVRNIREYNKQIGLKLRGKIGKPLPYIIIIVDELAELSLLSEQDINYFVPRLGALAAPVGIHLVFATQRLSVDVISGTIKNNFPSRISFRVRSKIDSRLILDTSDAERLLGMGDMIFAPPSPLRPIRLHGSFISIAEIFSLVDYVKSQGIPSYDERMVSILQNKGTNAGSDIEKDKLYDEAVRLILATGKASALLLQRRLKMGYERAARIIDIMEVEGLIGPSEGPKPRDILVGGRERLKAKSISRRS